jgi:hypothetical protein
MTKENILIALLFIGVLLAMFGRVFFDWLTQ